MSSNKDSRQRFLQRSWGIPGAGAESVGLIVVRFGASPGFASNWGVDLGRATPPCCAQVRNRARDVPCAICVCAQVRGGVTIVHAPSPAEDPPSRRLWPGPARGVRFSHARCVPRTSATCAQRKRWGASAHHHPAISLRPREPVQGLDPGMRRCLSRGHGGRPRNVVGVVGGRGVFAVVAVETSGLCAPAAMLTNMPASSGPLQL